MVHTLSAKEYSKPALAVNLTDIINHLEGVAHEQEEDSDVTDNSDSDTDEYDETDNEE